MGFKNKLNSVLNNTVEISKKVGKSAFDATKETIDDKIQDIEQNHLEKKEVKAEERAIKKLFNPDKKIGDLEVDTKNKLFKVKGATIKEKSSIAKKAIKTTAAIYTVGGSLIAENLMKPGDKIFNFSDILEFELLEDDISIASGGLGRALVGGVLGGAGAVVGAVTGKKTTKRKITKLIVKITINDFDFPCIMISFINKPIKNISKDYEKAFNEAHQILAMLNVMSNN